MVAWQSHNVNQTVPFVFAPIPSDEEIIASVIPTSSGVRNGAIYCGCEIVIAVPCGEFHAIVIPIRVISGVPQGVPSIPDVSTDMDGVLQSLGVDLEGFVFGGVPQVVAGRL